MLLACVETPRCGVSSHAQWYDRGMTLFNKQYRVESTRLKNWDYGGYGWYFVTICTKDRECCFGEVLEDDIHLSSVGNIVAEEWLKTGELRPAIHLDDWIVMPNHVHAIIMIDGDEEKTLIPNDKEIVHWKPGCLGAIINQFKGACTKRIHNIGYTDFSWQERFHDHLIRDQRSLDQIRGYVYNNPANWLQDRNHPDNVQQVRSETPHRGVSTAT